MWNNPHGFDVSTKKHFHRQINKRNGLDKKFVIYLNVRGFITLFEMKIEGHVKCISDTKANKINVIYITQVIP